ncbi:MAG: type I restriction modification enzyme protein S [Bacteroidetes bacterium OLB12]|nr:MAG: type I restriction modification enzyme protein S [Bacteroidetes bacterium OLB12]
MYRQSLLKAAFEGKLTRLNHDSPDLPDTLDLKAKRNQGHQENLTNQDADKSTLPKGWKEIRFKDIVHVNPKLPNKENISLDIEVQFLPMKLVEEVINKIHLTEIRKFSEVQKGSYTPFVDGDVIFAKVTPCMENGKIAVVDNLKNKIGYGSSEFHVIRCSENIKNKYAFYFLVQEKFRKEAENAMTGAVGLRRVPKQFIENYFIPLAPLEEQELIVSELESRLTVCDKLEETIAHALQQAETIRQSILKKSV